MCRFPRSNRLLHAADYSGVFSQNIRVSDRYWTILATPGQKDGPRLGMAIGKKRARRAVDRNRLKRIVREYFRHNSGRLGNVHLVVLNRNDTCRAENEILRESLDRLWDKLVRKCED